MWLSSQRNLKPHERFFIQKNRFYQTDRFPGKKGRTAIAERKGIPHTHVDLSLLVSIETTGVSTLIGIGKCYLQHSASHQVTPGMMQTSLSS
jgi:hypothetical protein